MRFLYSFAATMMLAAWFLCPLRSEGAVLDWSTVTWNPNNNTHTFTNVDNSGVDIRISLAGQTNAFSGSPNQYPLVTSSPHTGGLSPAPDSLYLRMDSFSNTNQSIRITVQFFETGTTNRAEVSDVSFTFFDVDRGSSAGGGTYTFQDEIRDFFAVDSSYTNPFGPTSVTGSSANTISGSGINIAATGTAAANSNTSDGNVDISFGNQQVSALRFWYGNGSNSQSNPALQSIAWYDINFTVVPEVGTVFGAGLVFLLAIGLHRLHSRKTAAVELAAR